MKLRKLRKYKGYGGWENGNVVSGVEDDTDNRVRRYTVDFENQAAENTPVIKCRISYFERNA